MKKTLLLAALMVFVSLPAAAQKPDAKGCKDDPLFPVRMPKYFIARCEAREYDGYEFLTPKPPRNRVEGEFTFITYQVGERADERSGLEVIRNYENAIRKVGGKIVNIEPNRYVNGVMTIDGKEVWAQAEKGNGLIWLRIIRKKEMDQIIVADAASMANDLKLSGHVAVHGIYFDTAKAELKPESTQAVGEVAKLLEADPSLKLYVVGHTDTVGNIDANLKLSQARAESVVQALVRDGVAGARLKSFGNGPFAPVGSNATEDGRAQNRRVELVKQ